MLLRSLASGIPAFVCWSVSENPLFASRIRIVVAQLTAERMPPLSLRIGVDLIRVADVAEALERFGEEIELHGAALAPATRGGIAELSLSMSHEREYATATVVARLTTPHR